MREGEREQLEKEMKDITEKNKMATKQRDEKAKNKEEIKKGKGKKNPELAAKRKMSLQEIVEFLR